MQQAQLIPLSLIDIRFSFRVLLFSLFLALVPAVAFAQTSVTATVDRNALNPDDTLTLTITVSSSDEVAISQPTLPSMPEFEVLNEWTSQEARATIANGPNGPQFKTVRSMRYNYMLQPKQEGTLPIAGVEVVVDGKSYITKSISIRVAQGAGMNTRPRGQQQQQPGGGLPFPPGMLDEEDEDLFSQLLRRQMPPSGGSRTLPVNPNEAFFIQVEADKSEAYVGEQVTVSWYLYTRGQIRDLDTLKYPSLKGFWKEDIEIATHLNFTQEIVNGLPYKKALLASFALFPMKEGTSLVDSYTAKCSVIPSMDTLSGAFGMGKAYTFTKSSQPLKIKVKPVPAEGRPADYSGAVGDFQVSARVEDNNIVTGQPFTLKVRFEGRGNAKLIDIPPFQAPEGMELYDTQKEAKFFRTGTSYKDFSILLIPRREGPFTIPAITASMFDPVKKEYVSKSTEPIQIHVGKGQGVPQGGQSMRLSDGDKKKQEGPSEPQLQTTFQSSRPMSNAEKGIGFLGAFALAGFALLWKAQSELGWGQKKKDLTRRLRARLKRVDAKVASGDWRGVGVELTNTMYFVLGEISGQGGANLELEKLLMKAPPSVRRELSEPLKKQSEVLQVLTFAPESVVGQLKEPAQLKKVVKEMEALMEKAVSLGLSSGQSGES